MATTADPDDSYPEQNRSSPEMDMLHRATRPGPVTYPGPQGKLKLGLGWPPWPVLWSGKGYQLQSGIFGSVNFY